jgi:hypothetical protein
VVFDPVKRARWSPQSPPSSASRAGSRDHVLAGLRRGDRDLGMGERQPRIARVRPLLAASVPLALVSKVLRHSQVSITIDLYGHLTREVAQGAADVLGAALDAAAAAEQASAAAARARWGSTSRASSPRGHKAPGTTKRAPPGGGTRWSKGCAARESNPLPAGWELKGQPESTVAIRW